jgi:glucose-6-phosphate isomerase
MFSSPPGTTAPHHKCTDCPQFTALHYAASSFRNDDKLHLKHLLADAFRCQGLVAVHSTSAVFERGFADSIPSSTYTNNNDNRNNSNNHALLDGGEGTSGDKAQEKTTVRRIILDYSRQQITGSTLELLFDLADRMGLTERMSEMRSGHKINCTESKPALHHLLRLPRLYYKQNSLRIAIGCEERLKEVWSSIDRISSYSNKIREGSIRGVTGRIFRNVLCITSGGMHYGTEAVYEALRADKDAVEAIRGRSTTISFVSNVDPVDFEIKTRGLDAEETLVIVVSKNFDSVETMYNARMARRWLYKRLMSRGGGNYDEVPLFSDGEIVKKHFCAVTADYNQAVKVSEACQISFWYHSASLASNALILNAPL